MFTIAFWVATGERAIKTAAQAVLTGLALSDSGPVDAFALDWKLAAGFAAGGAVFSVLTSVASTSIGSHTSPSLVASAEVDAAAP